MYESYQNCVILYRFFFYFTYNQKSDSTFLVVYSVISAVAKDKFGNIITSLVVRRYPFCFGEEG